MREWGEKKRQGALVCKPDTLAVTVNKLTVRKTVREGEVGVREREREREKGGELRKRK